MKGQKPVDPLAVCRTVKSCFLPSLVYAALLCDLSSDKFWFKRVTVLYPILSDGDNLTKTIMSCIKHLTAKIRAPKLSLGWATKLRIFGNVYTASPSWRDNMLVISIDSIAAKSIDRPPKKKSTNKLPKEFYQIRTEQITKMLYQ